MSDTHTGQVASDAAEVYESFFVPALFEQWTDRVLDAGGVEPGHRVLDVACGTGVLARAAARRVGAQGSVVGVDINNGMLHVARRSPGAVEWQEGAAEDLPFGDGEFDRAVCQFGLMFFTDRLGAVTEMARVTRPGGRAALAVWATLDENAGYRALNELIGRLFGAAAADALEAPFALGDQRALMNFLEPVYEGASVEIRHGTARFDSLSAWLNTEIRGWTLAGDIDEDQFRALERAASEELDGFVGADGRVEFPVAAVVAAGGVPGA